MYFKAYFATIRVYFDLFTSNMFTSYLTTLLVHIILVPSHDYNMTVVAVRNDIV